MAKALTAASRASVEAARGALLTTHAAAGLSGGSCEARRLLHAAEGLCRAAVAVLSRSPAPPPTATSPVPPVQEQEAAPARRKRSRKPKKKQAEEVEVHAMLDVSPEPPVAGTVGSLTARLNPGESIVIGDLSAFGMTSTSMVVPSSYSSRPVPAQAASGSAAAYAAAAEAGAAVLGRRGTVQAAALAAAEAMAAAGHLPRRKLG